MAIKHVKIDLWDELAPLLSEIHKTQTEVSIGAIQQKLAEKQLTFELQELISLLDSLIQQKTLKVKSIGIRNGYLDVILMSC